MLTLLYHCILLTMNRTDYIFGLTVENGTMRLVTKRVSRNTIKISKIYKVCPTCIYILCVVDNIKAVGLDLQHKVSNTSGS